MVQRALRHEVTTARDKTVQW